MQKKIKIGDKFFVAGAHGMAGSAICRALLKSGYGNSINGGEILKPKRKDLDLLDINEVKKWFKYNKPTIVIIAAAKVGGILANSTHPANFILENLKIQTNLIETAWNFGVKRLLFLGSSCIYPKFSDQPIDEESLLSGFLEQTNESYAIAKIAGIKLCEALRKQYSFDSISLMPTNLYGPGDNYHPSNGHVMAALISRFANAVSQNLSKVSCWGSGSPFREFMHADDLGSSVVFALENWDPSSKDAPKDKYGQPLNFLNVGTGVDISIKELANLIAKATGFNGEIIWDKSKPDGTPKKLLNINKIKSLGWTPSINLEDGIRLTVAEYLRIKG